MKKMAILGAAAAALSLGASVQTPASTTGADTRARIENAAPVRTQQSAQAGTVRTSSSPLFLSALGDSYPDFSKDRGMSPADWGQTRACRRMVRRSKLNRLGIGRRRS